MRPEELSEWKKRLRHSHNEWRAAGLIPDLEGGGTERYTMVQFLDAYRGDYPPSFPGAADKVDQMVGNILFSTINTMISQISGRMPDPIVTPLSGELAGPEARRLSWINEQIVRTMMVEKKFKDEMDMAVLSAVVSPFGIIRHGYTPAVEWIDDKGRLVARVKSQRPDLPWTQCMRPWQVRIDPMVNSFTPDGEPRWCAFQNLWYESQVRNNDNLIFREDLIPTVHYDIRPHQERKGKVNATSEDLIPMYEEWVIYEAETRTFFGLSEGSSKLIRRQEDWPFDWGQLPYTLVEFNRQLDSPFGVPFMRMIYDEQLMYNQVWTIIRAMVGRFRRLMIYRKDAFEEDESLLINADSLAEAIATSGDPNSVLKEFQFAQLDPGLVGILFQLKEQIREVLGVSQFDRGQRANVETATEASQIGAGSDINRARNQEKVENAYANMIKVAHRAFLDSPESRQLLIPIVGRDNLDFLDQEEIDRGFVAVDSSSIKGEFEYNVRLNSTMKVAPEEELRITMLGYNAMGGTDSQIWDQEYYHRKVANLTGQDPENAMMSREQLQQLQTDAQASGDPAGGTGGEAGVGPAVQGISAVPDVGAG